MSQSCKNILVVEDETAIRNFASVLLRKIGYNVIPACDAKRGLELANTHAEIHALLCDVELGDGMNGFELAHRIRQLKPGIFVIVMSGARHYGTLAAQRGFQFLCKPFTRAGFLQRVQELLAAFPGAKPMIND